MIHRLQSRLLLTFISIALLALLLVALFALWGTRSQFNQYVTRDSVLMLHQTAQLFRDLAARQDVPTLQNLALEVGRSQVAEVTVYDKEGVIVAASAVARVGQRETAVPRPPIGLALHLETADVSTIHFLAAGNLDEPIFLSRREDVSRVADNRSWIGNPSPGSEPNIVFFGSSMAASVTDTLAFTALAAPPPDVLINNIASQEFFWQLVNRTFIWAVVVSLLVAMLLSWLTSRRILQPVQALTQATQQMGQGNWAYRVAVSGQDELAELGQSFNKMADDLARQEELRRHLVTDVAHELLTPLTTVRGQLEAIQDGVLRATPTVINSLHEEVMLLDHLIADLQELSLAEAGQLRLDRQPVVLAEVVMGVVTAVSPTALAKNIHIQTEIPSDLPLISLDARRIGQVLRNLLTNAINHTEVGGEIAILASQQGAEVWVKVADTGEGIAPEHLPYLFDRFYRTDKSRARATGGSGLGLAIVQGLVAAHNGRVWVASTPNEGSKFTFTLPMSRK